MRTYTFIDASNLFYGGEKSLGWKIDYNKLLKYLQEKYGISKAFYFGGVELHKFQYDYLHEETVPIKELEAYLVDLLENKSQRRSEGQIVLLQRHLQRVRFYGKLQKFGYDLYLKPVKQYEQDDDTIKRKANCDVEMAYYIMREIDNFDRVVFLSGDGDFLPILRHLWDQKKDVFVLSRGSRTAKEIRQFAGGNFRDFEYLKYRIKMDEEK